MSQVAAIAIASLLFADPFWCLINSNEHYLDLYKFFIPLNDRLKNWSEDEEFNIFALDSITPLYEQYPHEIDTAIYEKANQFPKTSEIFRLVCATMLSVVKRQLSDHLSGGIYGSEPDCELKNKTRHSKLTNIPAENLFGDLDFSIKRKPNATLRHHSSISMLKRNKTVKWLKTKTEQSRKCLMEKSRRGAKTLKMNEIQNEKNVMEERKTVLEETKRRKLQTQQKMQNELNTIERKVRLFIYLLKCTIVQVVDCIGCFLYHCYLH